MTNFEHTSFGTAAEQAFEKPIENPLDTLLKDCGVNIERLRPDIRFRLEAENEGSSSIEAARHCMAIAEELFELDGTYTDQEKQVIFAGTVFSDIGKTGPLFKEHMSEAEKRQQVRLFLDIYRVSHIPDYETLKLGDMIDRYFPDHKDDYKDLAVGYGQDLNMTMRQFTNQHSTWTLQVINHDGVPAEAVPAAGLHHILEGMNPEDILEPSGKFKEAFGNHLEFNRDDMLVILLDKLEAFITRGHKSWDEVGLYLATQVSERARSISDPRLREYMVGQLPNFNRLIEDLLEATRRKLQKQGQI